MSGDEQSRQDPSRKPLRTEGDVTFPRLAEAQIATVRAAGRSEKLESGQVLFRPGDLDYDLVVVLEGCVEIIDDLDTDRESVLTSHGPRQFVGELNLITAEPALLTGRVLEEGEGIFVSREALRGVVSRDPRLGDLIMNALIGRRAMMIESEGGARLIGLGNDPATRELREFLTRNRVPHRFIDLGGSNLAAPLPDGRILAAEDLPTLLRNRAGIRRRVWDGPVEQLGHG